MDAIVATTFALNVLEPWNSGIGGGGAMVLYRAKDNRSRTEGNVGVKCLEHRGGRRGEGRRPDRDQHHA